MKIHTVDLHFLGYQEATAAYLLETDDGPILIETGPDASTHHIVDKLASLGYTPSDVKHVLVTHIHLDHSGAAGWWSEQGATIYVHPVGAPHLLDPSRLIRSATRIYKEKMDEMWGTTIPVLPEKLRIVTDGEQLSINGLHIKAIDTPGHATHHYMYVIGDVAFTGDAAGMRRPKTPIVDLPAVPPEFNLDQWLATIGKIRTGNFRAIYPTHYGIIEDVDSWLDALEIALNEGAALIKEGMQAGEDNEQLVARYQAWFSARARQQGLNEAEIAFYLKTNPMIISVTGISRYWRKRWEAEQG